MDYEWQRFFTSASLASDGRGHLTTEGGRFVIKSIHAELLGVNNSPFPLGIERWSFSEVDPSNNVVAGCEWISQFYQFAAGSPGIDTTYDRDYGEGLVLPSHTPFNEYRRFAITGGFPSSMSTQPPLFNVRFNFLFPYGMTGFHINWLT